MAILFSLLKRLTCILLFHNLPWDWTQMLAETSPGLEALPLKQLAPVTAKSLCWWTGRAICVSLFMGLLASSTSERPPVSCLSSHSQGRGSSAHTGQPWLTVGRDCTRECPTGGAGTGGLLDADNPLWSEFSVSCPFTCYSWSLRFFYSLTQWLSSYVQGTEEM